MQKFPKVMSCLYAVMVVASATEIRFDGYRFMGGHNCIEFDISHGANTVTINRILINQAALNPDVVNEITLIIPGEVKKQSSLYLLDDLACIGMPSYALNSSVRFPEWDILYAQTCINRRAFQGLALDNLKLKVIFEANNMYVKLPRRCSELFKGSKSITEIDFRGVSPNSTVTSTRSMFECCNNLEKINFGSFNTSNVRNMKNMFRYCESLKDLDLLSFDTRNVTDMSNMFGYCRNLKTSKISNFNTQNVTDMSSMFYICCNLKTLDLGDGFYTYNLKTTEKMFAYCQSLEDLNLGAFNTRYVTNMSRMFCKCSRLTTLDLSKFDTTYVKDMSWMFYGCAGLSALDLGDFCTCSLEDMCGMFAKCSSLTSVNLDSFDTGNVTDMSYMFYSCCRLSNAYHISEFDMTNIKDISYMFAGCINLSSIPRDIAEDISNIKDENAKEGVFDDCPNIMYALEMSSSESTPNCG